MSDDDLTPPHLRSRQIGREALEAQLRRTMGEGALSHGWILSGPDGAGKATLAYRIARGLLDPAALDNDASFDMSEDGRVFHLIGAQAHPDLFVAERLWDEKKSRYQTEISVETIRKLTWFLSRTASFGGWRVAIIDTADDMNRNAANALLKVLEEPPKKTLLLLLSAQPGRLLPTLRSRCRRLALPPLAEDQVAALLASEGIEKTVADPIIDFAAGRPGYALRLAIDDGADAIKLAGSFINKTSSGADVGAIIARLTKRDADNAWQIFQEALNAFLMRDARLAAKGASLATIKTNVSANAIVGAWEHTRDLISRGEGLNLDRGQLLNALAFDLGRILRPQRAA